MFHFNHLKYIEIIFRQKIKDTYLNWAMSFRNILQMSGLNLHSIWLKMLSWYYPMKIMVEFISFFYALYYSIKFTNLSTNCMLFDFRLNTFCIKYFCLPFTIPTPCGAYKKVLLSELKTNSRSTIGQNGFGCLLYSFWLS